MANLRAFLCSPLTSDRADTKLGSIAAFVVGALLPIMIFPKLEDLRPTEIELLLGLLLTITASLLCVLLGLVLPVYQAVKATEQKDAA